MKRVTELTDIGKNKNCLIIGGGISAGEIDYKSIPDDLTIIVVNDALYDMDKGYMWGIEPDYLIYNDKGFLRVLPKMKLPKKTRIISFGNNYCDKTFYFYNNRDTGLKDMSNTGLKALVITKKIMNFDKIYLIGFDFHTRTINGKEQSHLNGDRVGKGMKYVSDYNIKRHITRLSEMVKEFDGVKDLSGVFNCYKDSKLGIFPFGLPY